MSVSVYYSSGSIENAQSDRIVALADKANNDYQWWSEPISFFSADTTGLAGSSGLYRGIDDQQIDNYMAHQDLLKIIEFLKSVSSDLGVGWQVSIEDTVVGQIADGNEDDDMEFNLDMLADVHGVNGVSMNRDEILRKYAGQN